MSSPDPRTVFVGNLAFGISDADFKTELEKFVGPVVDSVRVFRSASGRSRGSAVATFLTPDLAQSALNNLQEQEIAGRKVFLRPDRGPSEPREGEYAQPPQSRRPPRSSAPPQRGLPAAGGAPRNSPQPEDISKAVFVGNLDFNASQNDVVRELKSYGYDVVSVTIPTLPNGRPKGFAIVELTSSDDASRLVNSAPKLSIGGRELIFRAYRVDPPSSIPRTRTTPNRTSNNFIPRESRPPRPNAAPSKSVFVGNVAFSATENDVRSVLEQFGAVDSVTLPTAESGRPRGYAIAKFQTLESASGAVAQLGEHALLGRRLFAKYDFNAQPEGEN